MIELVNNLCPSIAIINVLWDTCLLIGGMVVANYISFSLLDQILKRKSNNYPLLEHRNQRYVVKNLTKSGLLMGLLITAAPGIWNMFRYNQWDNQLIHTIGSIYVSIDLSGLLFVPNLPIETKIHHTCVMILGLINVFMDYTIPGLHRALISLTLLSMIPYLVNTYLGMRYLEGAKIKRWILHICLWLYSFSVLVNCILQHLYIFWFIPDFSLTLSVLKTLYLMLYYFILNDDVKLIKYLHYKYRTDF